MKTRICSLICALLVFPVCLGSSCGVQVDPAQVKDPTPLVVNPPATANIQPVGACSTSIGCMSLPRQICEEVMHDVWTSGDCPSTPPVLNPPVVVVPTVEVVDCCKIVDQKDVYRCKGDLVNGKLVNCYDCEKVGTLPDIPPGTTFDPNIAGMPEWVHRYVYLLSQCIVGPCDKLDSMFPVLQLKYLCGQ